MPGITALVLAGSRGPDDPMTRASGVRHKALILVGGEPMLLRVIRALAAAPEVGRIVICIEAPEIVELIPGLEAASCGKPVSTFPAAGSPSKSVAAALSKFGTPLLVTTGDHALLRPEWISHFLARRPADADATVALARSEVVLGETPGTQRTYLRFSEAWYSGCNLFHFATPASLQLAELWQQVEALRKQPLRMLRLLGFTYALRYRFGWLSLATALKRLGALAGGVRAAVVELPYGRAAIDIDKPADLELVERLLCEDRGRR
ncbi:MAG: nucleotidyltransferase family protein [Nevskia sp.]